MSVVNSSDHITPTLTPSSLLDRPNTSPKSTSTPTPPHTSNPPLTPWELDDLRNLKSILGGIYDTTDGSVWLMNLQRFTSQYPVMRRQENLLGLIQHLLQHSSSMKVRKWFAVLPDSQRNNYFHLYAAISLEEYKAVSNPAESIPPYMSVRYNAPPPPQWEHHPSPAKHSVPSYAFSSPPHGQDPFAALSPVAQHPQPHIAHTSQPPSQSPPPATQPIRAVSPSSPESERRKSCVSDESDWSMSSVGELIERKDRLEFIRESLELDGEYNFFAPKNDPGPTQLAVGGPHSGQDWGDHLVLKGAAANAVERKGMMMGSDEESDSSAVEWDEDDEEEDEEEEEEEEDEEDSGVEEFDEDGYDEDGYDYEEYGSYYSYDGEDELSVIVEDIKGEQQLTSPQPASPDSYSPSDTSSLDNAPWLAQYSSGYKFPAVDDHESYHLSIISHHGSEIESFTTSAVSTPLPTTPSPPAPEAEAEASGAVSSPKQLTIDVGLANAMGVKGSVVERRSGGITIGARQQDKMAEKEFIRKAGSSTGEEDDGTNAGMASVERRGSKGSSFLARLAGLEGKESVKRKTMGTANGSTSIDSASTPSRSSKSPRTSIKSWCRSVGLFPSQPPSNGTTSPAKYPDSETLPAQAHLQSKAKTRIGSLHLHGGQLGQNFKRVRKSTPADFISA